MTHPERQIVIVAEYPTPENLRDGMIQRVAAIDSLFGNQPRTYLSIRFKGNLRYRHETHGATSVHYLNYFRHHLKIVTLARRATTLYIHSAYNYLRLLPFVSLRGRQVIFDAHGVVPEELRDYEGRHAYATLISCAERLLIEGSQIVVTVTRKMADHFAAKYRAFSAERCQVVPIFDYARPASDEYAAEHSSLAILYSGGVQGWQNIPLMLSTLRRLAERHIPGMHVGLFVPQDARAHVEQQLADLAIHTENLRVTVESLPREELLRTYHRYALGFVLRKDDAVNRAACPTKLVEYLENGVVPIVLSPNIGDFVAYGYRYLTLDDLETFTFDPSELQAMRENNAAVIAQMRKDADRSANTLAELLNPGKG